MVYSNTALWASARYMGINREFPNYKENTTCGNEDDGAHYLSVEKE